MADTALRATDKPRRKTGLSGGVDLAFTARRECRSKRKVVDRGWRFASRGWWLSGGDFAERIREQPRVPTRLGNDASR
jgi:hypothetical protein